MGKFRQGFSITELLVVIIIVAILAAIAIPKFSNQSLRSKEAALRANLKLIREAADRAENDTGLTFDVDDLTSSTAPSTGWKRGAMGTNWPSKSVPAGSWRGPYLLSMPPNPITGRSDYNSGQASGNWAWTHFSNQSFNKNYIYFPSTMVASDGTQYRTW